MTNSQGSTSINKHLLYINAIVSNDIFVHRLVIHAVVLVIAEGK